MKTGLIFLGFAGLTSKSQQLLEIAKDQCDYLIGAMQLDAHDLEKTKSDTSIAQRYLDYASIRVLDKVIPYATIQDQEDILRTYGISICFVQGMDRQDDFVGKSYCEEKGIARYDLDQKEVNGSILNPTGV
jgi:glycerol-3-phosphate cytidylyltransferase